MKKWLLPLIFILAIITLVACTDPIPPDDDNDDDDDQEEVVDTVAPLLNGVIDIQINLGDEFNPRAGVTAMDDVDGDITALITITGNVNVNVAGDYTLTYRVVDAAGNEKELTRKVTVVETNTSDLFVINGDFSSPLAGTWSHWAGEGGASTASIVNGEAVIDITANGIYWYSTQFSQGNLTITQGKMYRLEFDARADVARGIVVKLEDVTYWGYIDELVELTTEMTTYTYEFFVTKPTIENGKLNFGLGNMTSRGTYEGALTKVYLDNIKFTEIEPGVDDVAPQIHGATDKNIAVNDAFDPLEGITVSDNRDITLTPDDIVITGTVNILVPGEYELTYTLEDASGNSASVIRKITVVAGLVPSTWLVVNGDFSEDQLTPLAQPATTGWGWHGQASFTAKIHNGYAEIEINNLGDLVHGVQFYQQNREITQGQIYKITFDAKALDPRPIMLAIEEGTTRRYDEIFFLTTEWETYEVQYEHVLSSFTNGKFAFFMGDIGDDSIPTTVYLDNIKVETIAELVDTTAPQLFGIGDLIVAKNSTFNPLTGVTVRDNVSKTLTAADIEVTGTVDTSVIGSYEITYTIEDEAGNVGTYVRSIEVIEKEDMLESPFFVVNGDMEVDQLTPMPQPATTGWGWHGAGTFTVAIENGIATINVTNVGTVPHGVQFYQQNRVIEAGSIYLLKFKMKADVARSFRLSLEAATDVRFFAIIDVTTEWVEYEVYITPSGGGFKNGKLGFFLGYIDETSVPTTWYIDDISIEHAGYRKDTNAPIIVGAKDIEVVKGSEFNPLAGISIFDIIDKSLTIDDIEVTGSVDTSTVGEYELTYTVVDAQGNEAVLLRTITVVEPAPAE